MGLVALLVVVVGMMGRPAAAQEKDIAGTWQGTLQAGQALRLVLKIAQANGTYTATLYSIDQKAQIPANSVTLTSGVVKIGIVAMGVTYEGKLAGDGGSMDGTFNQGGAALPLKLTRVAPADAWAIPEPPPRIPPMPATATPAFEVATIKPSKPDAQGKGFGVRGHRVSTFNTSVNDLIVFAYGLQAKQIVGGSVAWAGDDKFDITGEPDQPGTPNSEQLRGMIQKLLVERFQLKFHYEKKELPVYALVLGKAPLKMTPASADAGTLPSLMFPRLGMLPAHNATMQDFANVMQQAVLDRPVVDQTGLKGRWDFTLDWTPDESQFSGMGVKVPAPTDKADAPPPLFTAIQEQAGLKLEPTRAPVPVLVIDHLEKPSEN
jgi:uncharacterized protein (TIGR03435 family)